MDRFGGLWRRFRAFPPWAQLTAVVAAALVLPAPFTSEPDQATVVPSAPATTATTMAPTTTLLASLPPGADSSVVRVIDGDTIEVAGGTRVRLIGVDTPE